MSHTGDLASAVFISSPKTKSRAIFTPLTSDLFCPQLQMNFVKRVQTILTPHRVSSVAGYNFVHPLNPHRNVPGLGPISAPDIKVDCGETGEYKSRSKFGL